MLDSQQALIFHSWFFYPLLRLVLHVRHSTLVSLEFFVVINVKALFTNVFIVINIIMDCTVISVKVRVCHYIYIWFTKIVLPILKNCSLKVTEESTVHQRYLQQLLAEICKTINNLNLFLPIWQKYLLPEICMRYNVAYYRCAASRLRSLFWERLTDFAKLFLLLAASEIVAHCVFWCVLTSVGGILHAAAVFKR